MTPYVFDLERSARGLRLNRFLNGLTRPAQRTLFRDDPERAMAEALLDEAEKQIIRALDCRALMDRGASFFCLENSRA